jgi:hypothetical protein
VSLRFVPPLPLFSSSSFRTRGSRAPLLPFNLPAKAKLARDPRHFCRLLFNHYVPCAKIIYVPMCLVQKSPMCQGINMCHCGNCENHLRANVPCAKIIYVVQKSSTCQRALCENHLICQRANLPCAKIILYANVPMCQCANVPMCQCANVPMCQCANVPMCQCALCKNHLCANVPICLVQKSSMCQGIYFVPEVVYVHNKANDC